MGHIWIVESNSNLYRYLSESDKASWQPVIVFFKRIPITGILNVQTDVINGVHLTRKEARDAKKEMEKNNIYKQVFWPVVKYRVKKYIRDEGFEPRWIE